ncbi:MAG TPA: DUF3570 domain-containing protein [Gammaproteobacteria bacterium]|nr:DUF3570 domain-containing protein [Gammaproteobacteria bacterium]
MQLTKSRRRPAISPGKGGTLAAATCALLGPGIVQQVVAQELEPWIIDSAALYYGESDGRVRDFSISTYAKKEIHEERYLSLTLAVDTLTGASPTGAVPGSTPQTFTRPSGNDSYVIAAGELPLDDTFQDTRVAISASWERPISRLSKINLGVSVSDEFDYTHTGINASFARDFNNRNTSVSLGFAIANDTLDPIGGTPIALRPMLETGNNTNKRPGSGERGDETKDVVDILLGLTQVIDRHSIVQLNYSLSKADGYLTDPFKFLTVVDADTGTFVPGPQGSGLNLYLYESRPFARDKESLYSLYKRDINGNVFDVSYRYMTDDWEIDSHTVDMHYRFNFGDRGKYLQPHLRFYSQSAADFYRTVLFDGEALPSFASADYRLGEFDAITIGAKYGQTTRRGQIEARLEYYQQRGTADASASVGELARYDLYPDLDAVIAQISYKFGR